MSMTDGAIGVRAGVVALLLAGCVVAGGAGGAGGAEGREAKPAARTARPAPEAATTIVRVLLPEGRDGRTTLGASGPVRVVDRSGGLLVRGDAGSTWRVEARGARMRLVPERGVATPWAEAPLRATPADGRAFATWNGKRYRGELELVVHEGEPRAVNHAPLDDYLRGVVPLEMGPRPASERAALEAQAVASRSYAWVRMRWNVAGARRRPWDLVGSVQDQAYGGVDAERALTDAAIAETKGLVLHHQGRPVSAPYFSTCGGSTAEPSELFRERGDPFTVRVSDRIAGTDRFYCDPAPRFRWSRTLTRAELENLASTYLQRYGGAPKEVGRLRAVSVTGLTPSGRAAGVAFDTDRGRYVVRGNDVRFVFRAGGEMLNSTYITLAASHGPDGAVDRLEIRGNGYGHGVGMCQWGAIGRARAGHDWREILAAYYPGTEIRPLVQ